MHSAIAVKHGVFNSVPASCNTTIQVLSKYAARVLLHGNLLLTQCLITNGFPADPLKQQQPGPGQYPDAPAALTHPAPPAVSISHRLQGSKEAERRPAPGEQRCTQQSRTQQ
jgi:hypothetical protein